MVIFLIVRTARAARLYESSLRLLADRGHLVHIGFPFRPAGGDHFYRWVESFTPDVFGEPRREGRDEAAIELLSGMARDHPNISWGYLRQQRTDRWGEVLQMIRLCRDYLRYFDESFKDARGLREKVSARAVPVFFRSLMKNRLLRSPRGRSIMRGFLTACQRATPVSRSALNEIVDVLPDVVLVARLVDFGSQQDDYVDAAHWLGIPVGLPVTSWDNLTNKGLVRVLPDFVTVWNDLQKREAIELHGLPEDKVWVTGAQNFDIWFGRKPSVDRAEFCGRFGFEPDQALIAYLGSSQSIAGNEVTTVRDWLTELRAHREPMLRQANVIVRPHPHHAEQWEGTDLSDLGPMVVWPRGGVIPQTEEQRNDFYDTLHHAGAIVGLNTSAQIEASILGRPVLVLIGAADSASRKGTAETLHFGYLSDAEHGIAMVAETAAEHFGQLVGALRDPPKEANARFVREFLRPHGFDRPAAPILADAIERGAQTRKRPKRRATLAQLTLRAVLYAARPALVALQRKANQEVRDRKRGSSPASQAKG